MISQEAFDSMVLENMEDFDLQKAAGLAETINQLKTMGKDLSSIDVTGGEGREELMGFIKDLKALSSSSTEESNIQLLVNLATICQDKHPLGSRNQNMMRTNGGLSALISAINSSHPPPVLNHVFNLMTILCKSNVDNRDCFEPWGNEKLTLLVNSELYSDFVGNQNQVDMLLSCVQCAKILSRSEINKVKQVEFGMSEFMYRVLAITRDEAVDSSDVTELALEVCHLFKRLCTHDDTRKEMSCAYENGRRFLSEGFVPLLMSLSSDFKAETSLSVAALSAVRQIVVSEEAVKAVAKHGAMELPSAVYKWEDSPVELVRSVTGLMRNLCADDDRKHRLVGDGTLKLLISCMASAETSADALFMEHAFACCAAMTLRSPTNSSMLVTSGAMDHVVAGMRRHGDKPALQRQACLAFRNIAARCPNLHSKLLDAGAEEVLRSAGTQQESVDEAYAALRDLMIDVQFVRVDTAGMASMAFEQFGGSKPKFNPVFDETCDLDERVVNESRAPFATDNSASVFREDEEECDTEGCSHEH